MSIGAYAKRIQVADRFGVATAGAYHREAGGGVTVQAGEFAQRVKRKAAGQVFRLINQRFEALLKLTLSGVHCEST